MSEKMPPKAVAWTTLSDGSRYHEWRNKDENDPTLAASIENFDEYPGRAYSSARCWPDGSEWDCLSLMFSNSTVVAIRRKGVDLQEFNSSSVPFDYTGYHCMISHLGSVGWEVSESVDNEFGESLLSNRYYETAPMGGELLGADYARNFISDNDVEGGAYFDCGRVWQAFKDGSAATFGTTKISHEALDGGSECAAAREAFGDDEDEIAKFVGTHCADSQ